MKIARILVWDNKIFCSIVVRGMELRVGGGLKMPGLRGFNPSTRSCQCAVAAVFPSLPIRQACPPGQRTDRLRALRVELTNETKSERGSVVSFELYFHYSAVELKK